MDSSSSPTFFVERLYSVLPLSEQEIAEGTDDRGPPVGMRVHTIIFNHRHSDEFEEMLDMSRFGRGTVTRSNGMSHRLSLIMEQMAAMMPTSRPEEPDLSDCVVSQLGFHGDGERGIVDSVRIGEQSRSMPLRFMSFDSRYTVGNDVSISFNNEFALLTKENARLNRENSSLEKQISELEAKYSRAHESLDDLRKIATAFSTSNANICELLATQKEAFNQMEAKYNRTQKSLDELREIAAADGKNCSVCMNEISTHAFASCGHKCVCEKCAPKLNNTCPVCRSSGTVLRIYG